MKDMTHITKLVKDLSDTEIGYLLYELKSQERVFITQWYDSEMAQERGYRNAGHMIEVCEDIYNDIDDLIDDIEIPEDEDED
jgi:hypothetical protein